MNKMFAALIGRFGAPQRRATALGHSVAMQLASAPRAKARRTRTAGLDMAVRVRRWRWLERAVRLHAKGARFGPALGEAVRLGATHREFRRCGAEHLYAYTIPTT